MRKLSLVAVVLFAFAPLAQAAPGAVRCGKLVDVRTGRSLSDQIVAFDANGIITAVSPAGSLPAPASPGTVDLSNATCLPGLIDVHTHLTHDPTNSGYKGLGVSIPRSTVTGVKNGRLTLRAGFTTVRNVGARAF